MKAANPNNLIPASPQETLATMVRRRAAIKPDKTAYTFLGDGDAIQSTTWSQLDRRAGALATCLSAAGAAGQPVLLALPSGVTFIESLFACWYAGAIAVPVSLPRHQRVKHRLDRIIADAGAQFALGTAETRKRLEGDAAGKNAASGLTWIEATTEGGRETGSQLVIEKLAATPFQSNALLQYTSGSTGAPRGVIVTHANLMQNSAIIAQACGHGPAQTIAGWLPLFHDMGFVGMLQAAYSGAQCVFMSPERFLMRPWLWLKMISDYRACTSPAPNFAYDLCAEKVTDQHKAGLDLSCWKNALNGSEPVRAATLDRFAAAFASCGFTSSAFFPCYGLAESTLFVTGRGKSGTAPRRSADGVLLADGRTDGHVGCGRAFGDTQIAIVDPMALARVEPGAIGEIWVAGQSVAAGYWNHPEATAATFNARLAAAPPGESDMKWLRTGDLGFIADGELFITGRLRELIIIAGRNHFPVDLERTTELADNAIATFGAAAFSADINGVERLIIVTEVRREYGRPARGEASPDLDGDAVCRRIRAAVAAEHEVAVHDVVLLRPGALPRTTSGKVSRRETRDGYLNNTLERLGDLYVRAST